MELLLLAAFVGAAQAASTYILYKRTGVRIEQVMPGEASAPAWGTPERKAWHVKMRDWHANQVLEAGEAVRRRNEPAQ